MKERNTNFITLYLPKDTAIRELFRANKNSISGQLLKLIFEDLSNLGLILDSEYQQFQNFKFNRPAHRKSSDKRCLNNNYSFYIPKDLWWVIDRIDENLQSRDEKAKKAIAFNSRSRYIWSLFMRANEIELGTQEVYAKKQPDNEPSKKAS